ncbi:MAG: MASE3 domain-containing protein [Nitrososphaera sp.]|uniref:MASE3 domain-containing protein n=1 Tax=Nitrososphaera sp. TaxID=1971748 RepID=UPI00317CC578
MPMLSSQTRSTWQSLALALSIAVPMAGILLASGSNAEFESRHGASVLFLAAGAMGLMVFFQEMYAFYVTNSRRLLWMSAGFFTLGVGMIGSAITTGWNTNIDPESYVGASELFRVTSEFAASIFILLGTLRSDRSIQGNMEFKAYILVAAIMVAAASTIIYISTVQDGLSVPFYSSQYGWSLFSLYIELNVFIFFAVTCTVYVNMRKRSRSQILFWFIIGFILLAFSELAFTFERVAGAGASSALVWAGRLLLLAGFVTFVLGLSRHK